MLLWIFGGFGVNTIPAYSGWVCAPQRPRSAPCRLPTHGRAWATHGRVGPPGRCRGPAPTPRAVAHADDAHTERTGVFTSGIVATQGAGTPETLLYG